MFNQVLINLWGYIDDRSVNLLLGNEVNYSQSLKTAPVTTAPCTPPSPPPQDFGETQDGGKFGVFKEDTKSDGKQLTTKLDWRQISLEEWLEDLIHLTV